MKHSEWDEEGIILLLALFIITLLTVLVLEFNYSTRVEHRVASRFRDETLALDIAMAGVAERIALLREDRLKEIEEKEEEKPASEAAQSKEGEESKKEKESAGGEKEIEYPDHYGEDWAQEIYMEPFGEGYLSVKVIDESGKININRLVKEVKEVTAEKKAKEQKAGEKEGEKEKEEGGEAEEGEETIRLPRKWGQKDRDRTGEESEEEEKGKEEEENVEEPARYVVDKQVEKDIMRLIETLDVRAVDAEEVTGAIVDWMDSNDEGDFEDDAYRRTEGVDVPKNAPLEVLSELMMVEGVTGALFYGPKRPAEIDLEETMGRSASKRKREKKGLRDCLTVYSESKVNINTAPAEVLTALLEEENESLVKEIVSYTQKDYFDDLKEFEEEIGEHIPASFLAKIGVGSDCFQIIAEGIVGESKKRVRAYVKRDEDANIRILFWRVEG